MLLYGCRDSIIKEEGSFLLNKTAEKVLKCIIKKSKGNLEQSICICWKDFKNKKITNSFINSVCQQLYKEGYISKKCYLSCDEDDFIELFLKYEGYSYFDNKKTKNFKYWIPIIISNIIAILALIVAILAYVKQSAAPPSL